MTIMCLLCDNGVVVVDTAGSTLEAMALAVERSAVVLVCLCQGYKDSPSCRTGHCYSVLFINCHVLAIFILLLHLCFIICSQKKFTFLFVLVAKNEI